MIPQEKMAEYRATAAQRKREQDKEQVELQEQAWEAARQAADYLREHFGATRVLVYGSLARGGLLHAHSDIDLAAAGIDEKLYYRAVSRVMDLDSPLPFDLARLEDLPPKFEAVLKEEGVVLQLTASDDAS